MNSPTTPSIPGKCTSLTAKLMMLEFEENLLHLLNKNSFKFHPNRTVDLGRTTIWNKTPEALSWKSFHAKTLHSNLVTLVWLIVPVWNPIALFLSSELDSSQVAEAWRYTKPGPSPWKACVPRKDTKVGQTPLGFPIVFARNQGGFSCLVTS
jgi:hypothetical protein